MNARMMIPIDLNLRIYATLVALMGPILRN